MTVVAKAKDWLAEIRALGGKEDEDKLRTLVISIAETLPDLEGPVCEVVSERGGDDEEARWGWKEWARDFFERTRAKRAAEPVGGLKLVTAAKPKAVSEPAPPGEVV